jgi:hypothetical protein
MNSTQTHSSAQSGLLYSSDSQGQIIAFTHQIFDQLLDFVAQHEKAGAPNYVGAAGSHVRHIIEHYEALMEGEELADYDNRVRDQILETTASVARERLHFLKQKLDAQIVHQLDRSVQVKAKGSLLGEYEFVVGSTVSRELIFLASHAIHHCAILRPYCEQKGITIDEYFGIAPSTVAHNIASKKNSVEN